MPIMRPDLMIFWIQDSLYPSKFKHMLEAMCIVWWLALWKYRNQVDYRDNDEACGDVFHSIIWLSFFWISSRYKKAKISWPLWAMSPSFLL